MKLAILLALVAVALAAPQSKPPVPIVSQQTDVNADGSYRFSYETGDGIKVEESGKQKQVTPKEQGATSQGTFSYQAPDGQVITMTWVADENGFQPKGAHIPTPPPVPDHVVKLLDDLRRLGAL